MSNFLGWFFHVLGGKKFFLNLLKNILATTLKSYIKWLLYIYKYIYIYIYFFFWKSLKKLKKNWNYCHKSFVMIYSICYTWLSPYYYKTSMIDQIGSTKLVLPKWLKYGTLNRVIRVGIIFQEGYEADHTRSRMWPTFIK